MSLASSFSAVLDQIRSLPDRLAHVEGAAARLVSIATDLKLIASSLAPLLVDRPEPTYVYVLPPNGQPMMMQRAYVERRGETPVTFQMMQPLPAGSWVLSAGPAVVRSVRVGNIMQQSVSADMNGHICKTVDECHIGCMFTVWLAG
ncbi:MAG TPA: hypothetical protein VGK73_03985 [Polyangiaceae bacterium]